MQAIVVYPRMRGKGVLIGRFVQLVVRHLTGIAVGAKKRKDLFALVERLFLLDLECDQSASG